MNRNPAPKRPPTTSSQAGRRLAVLTALLSLSVASTGQNQREVQSPIPESAIHVTQVLGFEGGKHNATGELRLQDDVIQFQVDGRTAVQVNTSSIQDIFVESGDKQIGGTAMMLGKAAVPYGGGRMVSLFAHKKYDFLTVEYLDNSGALHGAIFQLEKEQGETFKKSLVAKGAHIGPHVEGPPIQNIVEAKNENNPAPLAESSADGKSGGSPRAGSIQVDRVDPGNVGLDPSFGAAIYENLLEELTKTEQFKQVFRAGDRSANDVSGLLILKTTVQKYTPGSETRRAVTTVSGATKLKVRVQLVTREGQVVQEHVVDGNVRFIGGNLRATHNLAHNVALTLKRSALTGQVDLVREQETGKMSN